MNSSARRSFSNPDHTIELEKGTIRVVGIDSLLLARGTAESGWKWSEHAKPSVKTELCQKHHTGWVVSGRVKYVFADADGEEMEFGPGDIFSIDPGHDAFVVGEEPFEYIEVFQG